MYDAEIHCPTFYIALHTYYFAIQCSIKSLCAMSRVQWVILVLRYDCMCVADPELLQTHSWAGVVCMRSSHTFLAEKNGFVFKKEKFKKTIQKFEVAWAFNFFPISTHGISKISTCTANIQYMCCRTNLWVHSRRSGKKLKTEKSGSTRFLQSNVSHRRT